MCNTWTLYFNTTKCKVLHIGKDNPRNYYKMKVGTDLVNVHTGTEENDFGITFDKLLKFDVHIQNAVNKANGMIDILRCTFTFLDKDTFLQLYKAFIRPHAIYSNAICYPYLNQL